MAFVVGIDEAGYGPLLGPLVVSGVLLECPDACLSQSLWEVLRQSVSPQLCRNDTRLPILDSKKLNTRGGGVRSLERTALVMLATADVAPRTFRELLAALAPNTLAQLGQYPWYREFDLLLPAYTSAADISTRANAIRMDMANHKLRIRQVTVEPLLEGQFNQVVEATRNKATALVSQTLRVLDAAFRIAGAAPLRAVIDRQGGRSHYAPTLMTAFPGYEMKITEESETRSCYEMSRQRARDTQAVTQPAAPVSRRIEFITGGESHHLATALASIISKYLRELFMAGFNQYWRVHKPDLAPTAGYYEDGRRFLRDIEPELVRSGVNRRMLIRAR